MRCYLVISLAALMLAATTPAAWSQTPPAFHPNAGTLLNIFAPPVEGPTLPVGIEHADLAGGRAEGHQHRLVAGRHLDQALGTGVLETCGIDAAGLGAVDGRVQHIVGVALHRERETCAQRLGPATQGHPPLQLGPVTGQDRHQDTLAADATVDALGHQLEDVGERCAGEGQGSQILEDAQLQRGIRRGGQRRLLGPGVRQG